MGTWAATEAKAKFSEILTKAVKEGPQIVRRRGEEFIIATRVQFERVKMQEPEIDADGKTSGERLWDRLRCPPPDGVDDVEFPRMAGDLRKVDF